MSKRSSREILVYSHSYDENVTGSNHLLSAYWPDGLRMHIVVEKGLFFGEEEKYNFLLPYRAEKVDVAFCTHPHIDHCGGFPFLVHKGFQGPIYTSKGTALLYKNVIENSSNIVIQNYKAMKQQPPFTLDDVERSIENVRNHAKDYDIEYEYKGRLFFTFIPNQHIFGSCSILLRFTDPNPDVQDVVIYFSGDYNDKNLFIPEIPLPEHVSRVRPSVMFTESTYGDSQSKDVNYHFKEDIVNFMNHYDTLLVLASALGRTQDVLFLIKQYQDEGIISDEVEVWVDGPLAISNTLTIHRNPDVFCIKEEAKDFLPKNLHFASKKIRGGVAFQQGKKIIVTGSGMGSFGPARQYIPWLLPFRETCIIFGGFCTKDSLGYDLMTTPQGEAVNIFGDVSIKNALVLYLEELSAHGRSNVQKKHVKKINPKSVIINHGELEKEEALKREIESDIHPSKGTYIASRERFYLINCFGVVKSTTDTDLKYF